MDLSGIEDRPEPGATGGGQAREEHGRGRPRALLAVSNHTGIFDAWVIASAMPVAFAVKVEMAAWPIMGRICRNVGMVFVERARRMDTSRFVDEVRQRMRDGVRVLVFPEGTTGDGVDLLPFKTGGFEAVAGMVDGAVLPVHLNLAEVEGRPPTTAERRAVSWPSGSMLAHALRALAVPDPLFELRIGRPIPTAGRDRKELAEAAREAVRELGAGTGPQWVSAGRFGVPG